MPPRWLSASIVVFWLAATGWLFWHDLWPNWSPGEPPKFHIDLVEEVQNKERLRTAWNVFRQRSDEKPRDLFRAYTWVDYQPQEDIFTLHAELTAKSPREDETEANTLRLLSKFKVQSLTSEYRVSRSGQLRELRSKVSLRSSLQSPTRWKGIANPIEKKATEETQFVVWGEVRGEQFFAHCRAGVSLKPKLLELDLPPTPVSRTASVLLPLHPVNRIHGLRLGQRWRQPLVDPFRASFGPLAGDAGGIHYINAHVLPEPQTLTQDDDETICLVIEYEEDGEIVGRTWVEQDSERVEQQEAVVLGDRWFMKRDNPRKAFKRRP